MDVLSSKQFDDMLKSVDTSKKLNDSNKKISGARFQNVCARLKYGENPSESLINFLVNNIDFSKVNSENLVWVII